MTYEADQDGVLSISASEGDTLRRGREDREHRRGGRGATRRRSRASRGGADEQPEPSSRTRTAPRTEPEPEQDEEGARRSPRRSRSRSRAEETEPEPEPSRGEAARRTAHPGQPVARRMAREMGSSSRRSRAPGPGGRIVKADVEAAAGGRRRSPRPRRRAPPRSRARPRSSEEPRPGPPRPATARPAAASPRSRSSRGCSRPSRAGWPSRRRPRRTSSLHVEVDMEEAVELRKQLKAAAGDPAGAVVQRPVVKAAALALTEFPRANGAYRDGQLRALLARQRRRRRRGPGRARRPDDLRRRPQVARRDRRASRARAGREGPRRQDHPAGALRRHLHGLQPRHVRHRPHRRR